MCHHFNYAKPLSLKLEAAALMNILATGKREKNTTLRQFEDLAKAHLYQAFSKEQKKRKVFFHILRAFFNSFHEENCDGNFEVEEAAIVDDYAVGDEDHTQSSPRERKDHRNSKYVGDSSEDDE